MIIHIVMGGGIVFAAYIDKRMAETHALTVTGSAVVPAELHTRLAPEARDDIAQEEAWDLDDETPVEAIDFDDIV